MRSLSWSTVSPRWPISSRPRPRLLRPTLPASSSAASTASTAYQPTLCPTATGSSPRTSGATSLLSSTLSPTCQPPSIHRQTAKQSVLTRCSSSIFAPSATTSKTTGKSSCPALSSHTTTLFTHRSATLRSSPTTATIPSSQAQQRRPLATRPTLQPRAWSTLSVISTNSSRTPLPTPKRLRPASTTARSRRPHHSRSGIKSGSSDATSLRLAPATSSTTSVSALSPSLPRLA